jgi:hypothetical protein
MEPVLPCKKNLAEKLETTQDTQGFISHVRKLFIQMSENKPKHATKKISKKSWIYNYNCGRKEGNSALNSLIK